MFKSICTFDVEKRRRAAAAGLLITVGVAGAGAGEGARTRSQPAFTFEQAVRVRTLGHFAVSPDGRFAAYALAGDYFGFPVVPRFGDENNIYIVDLKSGEIQQATSGDRPKLRPLFSPTSDRIAYESDDDVWVVRLADGQVTRITTNESREESCAWSPDGAEVTFVSNRGGRTDLWAASVEGEPHGLRRLTDNGLREDDPQWSPDGRTIVFSAKGPEDFYSQGVFSIPAAGGPVVHLTADDGFDHSTARWSPDGRRLAFLSDRSGFTHVWTMSPDGGDARHFDTGPHDSTSPHFQVEPMWSPAGDRILVSVNREGSYDLVTLSTADGRVTDVAGGDGQYHEVGWRRDGALVFAWENAWSPPDLYVDPPHAARKQLTFSSHVVFRENHTARLKRVRFRSTDGFEVRGFLMVPRTLDPDTPLPAIVLLHPNGYGQFYDHWSPFFHYLAESGYVLLLVDQRGSSGYGRAYRRAQIGQWGQGTFEDVKAAAAFIREDPRVDPARVGVMGLSFGGYQALLALTKTPDLFQAGVDLMGPTDRRGRPGDRYRELQIGASEAEDPALYDQISPITSVADLTAPLLVIHSDQDRNVPPEHTYRLIDELERWGKQYAVKIYRNEAHGLADPDNQLDSYRRIVAFFDRWLAE